MADGHALALEGLVVVGHPLGGLGGVDEGEGERADAELGGQVDGLAVRAGHPDRRMGLLHRLGQDVANGHREVFAGETRIGVERHHVGDLLDGLAPHGAPVGGGDPEPFELGPGGRFTRPPVHAAARHQIERGDALGDPGRRIVGGRHQHDPVTEPDAPRALGGRGQEHLGRRGVRVLLEEVVLDLPGVIDAQAIGQLHLVQRVLEEPELGALLPRTGQLMLVEDPEFHARSSPSIGAEETRSRLHLAGRSGEF